MSSAKMRARMSVTEPAPNGTTTVTRWVGQFCAETVVVEPTPTAATAAAPNSKLKIRFIEFLPSFSFRECGGSRRRIRLFVCHQFVETPTKILQHYGSGITSRPARNRAAGVRRGTGLVETRDRHPVLRPAGGRPKRRCLRRILRAAVA